MKGRYIHLYAAFDHAAERIYPYRHSFHFLEVGVWSGKHARQLLRYGRKKGLTTAHYYGFDLFEDFDGATRNRGEFNKEERSPSLASVRSVLSRSHAFVRLFRGDTRKTLPRAAPFLPPMDVVFVDGGHSVGTIASDWRAIRGMLHQDSLVLFDDYYPDRTDYGAKAVIDMLQADPRFEVELLDPVDEFSGLRVQMVRVRCPRCPPLPTAVLEPI